MLYYSDYLILIANESNIKIKVSNNTLVIVKKRILFFLAHFTTQKITVMNLKKRKIKIKTKYLNKTFKSV